MSMALPKKTAGQRVAAVGGQMNAASPPLSPSRSVTTGHGAGSGWWSLQNLSLPSRHRTAHPRAGRRPKVSLMSSPAAGPGR
jgi:hypothetical protein